MQRLDRKPAAMEGAHEQSRRLLCFRDGDLKVVEVRDLDTGETLMSRLNRAPAQPLPLCSFSIVTGEWRDLRYPDRSRDGSRQPATPTSIT